MIDQTIIKITRINFRIGFRGNEQHRFVTYLAVVLPEAYMKN